MSYVCEKCEQENTVSDVLGNLVKIAVVIGVGYMAFTFRDQIKDVVGTAIEKGKKQLSGQIKRKQIKRKGKSPRATPMQ